ncbi:esterase family protein [Paenibacillus sp. IB182496]|uniref:Esterase family protein n=1 Tax=Paenibacillus sabuli TaxID=2772509 RepID=A0A927BW50_9BACL|nr:alpha/beta hydrolase-fold protein [Paenibacillus sabuli]MBD2847947.1 esterase family protein [Paenibacillus sabuli]
MSDANYTRRTINKEVVPSEHLPEGERALRVYLPPGYNQVVSYPVIYCQDGEDFFNFGRIATQVQKMILDDEMEPVLVVGVDVDKSKRTAEYTPDGDRHEAYVRFFVEEMMPYVASRYTVRGEADQILLAGDSLGGTVSLHIALAYPRRFRYVLSMSGAYYPASRRLAAASDERLDWLKAYMIVGLQETAFETDTGTFDFVALNRDMKAVLEKRGAQLHYEEKDGKHQWGFWQRELPAALAWFAREALG